MGKRVKAIVRADDIKAMLRFDLANKNKVQWYMIPKGYGIRILEREVYFDSYGKDTGYESGKVILIGYTPDITMVGLVAKEDVNQLATRPNEVSAFKINI